MTIRFNVLFSGVLDMDKVKKVVTVFELPQRLGILQYVEYEPQPKQEWCAPDWCPYEGVLTAEGCKKGICIKYKVLVQTKDRRQWVVARKKRRDEDEGGCLKLQVASALLELAERYDVGVWREKIETGNWLRPYEVRCGVVVNGVKLEQPYCRTVEECVKYIIFDYKQEEKRLREPPPPDPVEELLKEWPELEVFGREWIERFSVFKDRLAEIAKVLRKFPWMRDVICAMKEKPQPYAIFVLVAKDESDAYLTFDWNKAYTVRNGSVKEVKLELQRSHHEQYNGKTAEVYRPRGLLAFTATAKEYVRVL